MGLNSGMNRRKKIKIVQISLFLLGILIIYSTYYGENLNLKKGSISDTTKKKIIKDLKESETKGDNNIFYNVKYSGIDLSGNRYILTCEEAVTSKTNESVLDMKDVKAKFYFKDQTVLNVSSNKGKYNNQTLDMKFENKVIMDYNNDWLKADNAEYSNSGNYLLIENNVKVNSNMGNISADKLFFDLKMQKLNIGSFQNNNINANIKINEKRF
jgi:lipopolysaccharide export system protein LptA